MEEKGILHIIKKDNDFIMIDKDIILNPNIDFYSLGVYVRLKQILETKRNIDELCKFGTENYIQRAFEKLEKEKYIAED